VTNEIYVGAAFTVPANPFFKFYFDVDGDDIDTSKGTYLQFGVSQPIPLAEGKATLTPMFNMAYNWGEWIADGGCDVSDLDSGANCWNDANLGVKLALPVTSKFTITPAMYLAIGLNDTVKAVGYGDGDTKFWGGVSLTYARPSDVAGPEVRRGRSSLYCRPVARRPADHTPASSPPSRPARRVAPVGPPGPGISSIPASPSGHVTADHRHPATDRQRPRKAARASPAGPCAAPGRRSPTTSAAPSRISRRGDRR
jgi:hypothetical protein